jgi:hypothetical protein
MHFCNNLNLDIAHFKCYVLNLYAFIILLQDELEITSRLLGRKGGYSGTIVLLKNKATGELIAEGRHSLFGRHNSKM